MAVTHSLFKNNLQTKNCSKSNREDNKLQENAPCSEKIRKITDINEYILKQKWKQAGHIVRMKD